jgi:hypothetical protein
MECLSVSHDELSDLLRSLPQEPASIDFTARTLARTTGEHRSPPRLRSAFAVALALVAIFSGAIGIRRHQEQVRLRQLRAEQQQIRKELNELKALSKESEPRVFVGSSGAYDFVVGLKPRSRSAGEPRPVSLHIANDGIS